MKKTQRKQWIGAALVVLGVIALVLSHSIKSEVGEEMENVEMILEPVSRAGQGGKMASESLRNRASGEAGAYLQNAQFLMIGGVALIIAGGCMIFLGKKKK